MFDGDDPAPVLREIMQRGNDDGPVLVQHVLFDTSFPPVDEGWLGFADEEETPEGVCRYWFRLASRIPASYAAAARAEGYELQAGRGMLVPGRTNFRRSSCPVRPRRRLMAGSRDENRCRPLPTRCLSTRDRVTS
jgi:hypothetical protein